MTNPRGTSGYGDRRRSGEAALDPVVFDAEGSFRVLLRVTTSDGGSCTDARFVDVGTLPAGLPPAVAQKPAPGDPARSSMSEAMHAYHGSLQVDPSGALLRDGPGAPVLRDPLDSGAIPLIPSGPGVPMEQNCFLCHPGRITQCFRGAMFAAGTQCGDCHGDMLAVGGVYPLLVEDGSPLGPRRPWPRRAALRILSHG